MSLRAVYLQENSFFDAAILSERLEIDFLKTQSLIDHLLRMGMIKPCEDVETEPDAKQVSISARALRATSYQLNYVGAVLYDNLAIYCYPKYISSRHLDFRSLQLVFAALRKYNAAVSTSGIHQNEESSETSPIATIMSLLDSYEENGLYANREKALRLNGAGEIDWAHTINKHLPVLIEGLPYYMSCETVETNTDYSSFMSRLHASVLTDCSRELDECGLLNMFAMDPLELSDCTLADYSDRTLIENCINQEIRTQFVTWKQRVLQLIRTYIDNGNISAGASGITCYGTSSFHVIWEQACKTAFGDMLTFPLSELPITLSPDWGKRDSETLLEIIPAPQWRVKSSDGQFINCDPVRTLVPDAVIITNDRSTKSTVMYILDAKYYVPKFAKKITGAPELESVTKQLLYQSAYRDFVLSNNFSEVRNIFLIPTADTFPQKVAETRFSPVFYEGPPFSPIIETIAVPADKVLAAYVKGEALGMEYLNLDSAPCS